MDNIEKFLKRLTKEERGQILKVLEKIIQGAYGELDVKKMKGYGNLYRVRIGTIRVVFIEEKGTRRILLVSRRNEQTYSDF